jgi:calcium permeable stress-gated cation channel
MLVSCSFPHHTYRLLPLCRKYINQLVTGYLPSVILQIFLYTIAPIMMLFSTLEGPTSHSERKRSACCKVMYFTVWNVFFVNVLSGTVINQVNVLSKPKDIPIYLARAVPGQVNHIIHLFLRDLERT